jgi:hypothetical protein
VWRRAGDPRPRLRLWLGERDGASVRARHGCHGGRPLTRLPPYRRAPLPRPDAPAQRAGSRRSAGRELRPRGRVLGAAPHPGLPRRGTRTRASDRAGRDRVSRPRGERRVLGARRLRPSSADGMAGPKARGFRHVESGAAALAALPDAVEVRARRSPPVRPRLPVRQRGRHPRLGGGPHRMAAGDRGTGGVGVRAGVARGLPELPPRLSGRPLRGVPRPRLQRHDGGGG